MEDAKKLRENSVAELEGQLADLNSMQFKLRCENSIQRKLEKSHVLKAQRRQKARILTILREKERVIAN